MSELKALVFSIQRFSIQDGPGIRTTLFLKGCPLRCFWCANPESWHPFPEIMTSNRRCIRAGRCREVCPTGAITVTSSRRTINRAKCNRCLACAATCLTGAIRMAGEYVTVDEALTEASADNLFYQHSGGGVTLSGGEPLLQVAFARELAERCRARALHVALDTSGAVSPESLEEVLPYVDLVLFDVKHMDARRHKEGTGRDNALILSNARRAAAKVETWLRLPLIPGFNDSRENLAQTAEFARDNGLARVSILPYHDLWKPKYRQLGWRLRRALPAPPTETAIQEAKALIESFGLSVTVGK